MQKKKYFPATDVISLHLCDQGVQEGAGGESRMLQRPTKRFISYSALAHLLAPAFGVLVRTRAVR